MLIFLKGIKSIYVLGEEEALMVSCEEEFEETVAHLLLLDEEITKCQVIMEITSRKIV